MYIKNVMGVVKKLWAKWDVRGLMLLSLSLQTLLLLLAPQRKRRSNVWFTGGLLCLYLLADWSANYAAGVITSSEGDAKNRKNEQPMAFWSTFLLVHLGGPDSITAFAMVDNDFWHRHALALVFQCVSATYIFFQTLVENQLWLPTLLMFVCGFIRYYERTRSLYLASLNNLRVSLRKQPDPGPDLGRTMNSFRLSREAGLPTRMEMIEVRERKARVKRGRLNEEEVVLYAYQFFSTFKRLIVDLKCSYYDRNHSREFFLGRTALEAFKVIELELSFMYDILFTKASVVYNRKGVRIRLFTSLLVVVSFGLFYCMDKRFKPSDIAITYFLLLGAIALDVIALIQFTNSNWRTAFVTKHHNANWLVPGDDEAGLEEKTPLSPSFVWTHSLIDYCLNPCQPEMQKIFDKFGVSDYFDWLRHVGFEKFTVELREHIFEQVKMRSELLGSFEFEISEAMAARGNWCLRGQPDCGDLLRYVDGMDHDESLLSWHVATDLLLSIETEEQTGEETGEISYRVISKHLSEYMMYLMAMQPEIMYGVTDIGQIRLRDTRAEVQKVAGRKVEDPSTIRVIYYFLRYLYRYIFSLHRVLLRPLLPCDKCKWLRKPPQEEQTEKEARERKRKKELCREILNTDTEIEPVCIKGDKSKSVLYDGCRLAKRLQSLEERKWQIMSRVWVEMLTYAAVHCRPQTLMQQLSKGGELICFVWLLMAHFGLVDHFEVYDGLVRAKPIVEK